MKHFTLQKVTMENESAKKWENKEETNTFLLLLLYFRG